MYETMLFTIETTADNDQVPRVRIKRVPGTAKTATGTSRENGREFAPGTETSLEPLKHTLFGEKLAPPPPLESCSFGFGWPRWDTLGPESLLMLLG